MTFSSIGIHGRSLLVLNAERGLKYSETNFVAHIESTCDDRGRIPVKWPLTPHLDHLSSSCAGKANPRRTLQCENTLDPRKQVPWFGMAEGRVNSWLSRRATKRQTQKNTTHSQTCQRHPTRYTHSSLGGASAGSVPGKPPFEGT